ncbi:MAG: hypothetical protein HYT94_01310 [Parcubacteria group bacterium]|nr:hypothetical protein [Parcubacteria group bacterium]
MTKNYFIGTVVLIVVVAMLNYFAFQFHWYWKFWWFDMIMHTLGGAWVASFALWYRFYRNPAPSAPLPVFPKISALGEVVCGKALATALSAVLVIGIGWELFEFSVDTFIAFSRHDPVDTASDIFFDVLGSIIAIFIFFLMYNRQKRTL